MFVSQNVKIFQHYTSFRWIHLKNQYAYTNIRRRLFFVLISRRMLNPTYSRITDAQDEAHQSTKISIDRRSRCIFSRMHSVRLLKIRVVSVLRC